MSSGAVQLSAEDFRQAFPFGFVVAESGELVLIGAALERLFEWTPGVSCDGLFDVRLPRRAESLGELVRDPKSAVVLGVRGAELVSLQHPAKPFQTPCSGRADAADRAIDHLCDGLVVEGWIRGQEAQELLARGRQLVERRCDPGDPFVPNQPFVERSRHRVGDVVLEIGWDRAGLLPLRPDRLIACRRSQP